MGDDDQTCIREDRGKVFLEKVLQQARAKRQKKEKHAESNSDATANKNEEKMNVAVVQKNMSLNTLENNVQSKFSKSEQQVHNKRKHSNIFAKNIEEQLVNKLHGGYIPGESPQLEKTGNKSKCIKECIANVQLQEEQQNTVMDSSIDFAPCHSVQQNSTIGKRKKKLKLQLTDDMQNDEKKSEDDQNDISSFPLQSDDKNLRKHVEKVVLDETMNDDLASVDDVEKYNGETVVRETKGNKEMESFTVIANVTKTKPVEVKRVLPQWLTEPTFVKVCLHDKKDSLDAIPQLDGSLIDKLKRNGIRYFFPVQREVIPVLLESVRYGFTMAPGCYRPNDLCVSAPTGSGKTLAFVLPIVHALQHRSCCQIRALVVLPVKDLAQQVFQVFQTYCKGTKLKVVLCVSGNRQFVKEQESMVRFACTGYQTLADIIVATPGRLVDHIEKTPGFSLTHLRFLVLDEADRSMEDIKHNWLDQVNKAVYGNQPGPGPLTPANVTMFRQPFQKLLFSATLSQNPEKLQQLGLFQPKLFTSVVTNNSAGVGSSSVDLISQKEGEFVGKYTTPHELTEQFIECSPAIKPLLMLYFLHKLCFRQVLCFVNTQESAHRLYLLLQQFGGLRVHGCYRQVQLQRRNHIMKKLSAGKVDVVVCSDLFARGMDVENVRYVISYDPPPYIKTYIHRVGRTARAGKPGTAITFLQKKEIHYFKNMLKNAGKTSVKETKIRPSQLRDLEGDYKIALSKLAEVLELETQMKNNRWHKTHSKHALNSPDGASDKIE